jgi:hypothetical protein
MCMAALGSLCTTIEEAFFSAMLFLSGTTVPQSKTEIKSVRDNPAVGRRANTIRRWRAGTRIFTKFAHRRDHAASLPGPGRMMPAEQTDKARTAGSIEQAVSVGWPTITERLVLGWLSKVAGVIVKQHLVPWTCAYVLDRCTVVLPARCRGRAKRSEAARSRPSLAAARCHPGSTGVADARESRKRDRPTTRGNQRCFCKRGGDV